MNFLQRSPFGQLMVSVVLTLTMGFYLFWAISKNSPENQVFQDVVVPGEVVKGWAKTFPHAPTLAVALTTEHFRDGRAPDDWVEDIRGLWSQLRFRYQTGQVRSGWTNGDTALVIFNATSISIWGKHNRREEYRLIKNAQGQWRLDQFRLVTDQIL